MPNILVKYHLVQKLLSGHKDSPTHGTHCSTWNTEVVIEMTTHLRMQ